MVWYQHDGFNDGSAREWALSIEVGSGWTYSRLFSGGDDIVYVIRKDGNLFWYKSQGADYGARNWSDAKEVGSDWGGYKDVFSTGKGAVFAVKPDGTLLYKHIGFENGAKSCEPARSIGAGWNQFQQIIPCNDGVILTVRADGKLLWYKYRNLVVPTSGLLRPKQAWEGPVEIGSGWQDFGKVIALIPDAGQGPR